MSNGSVKLAGAPIAATTAPATAAPQCKCEPLSDASLILFKIGSLAAVIGLGIMVTKMHYRKKKKGTYIV